MNARARKQRRSRRLSKACSESRLVVEGLEVDLVSQTVMVEDAEIELSKRQFLLLVYLLRNIGRVVSDRELRGNVLRAPSDPESSNLRNHVAGLRRRLGSAGGLVVCVRGVGYGIGVASEKNDGRPPRSELD